MSAENSKFIPSSELQKDMFCIHLDEKSGDSLPRCPCFDDYCLNFGGP